MNARHLSPQRRTAGPLLALAALVALASCRTRAPLWSQSLDIAGPLAVNGELAFLNRTTAIVTLLDPSGSKAPVSVNVTHWPRAFAVAGTNVVVAGGTGAAPELDIVSVPSGDLRSLALPGAYDRAAVSPDGNLVVLDYDPSKPPAPGGPAARNNDQLSVVDLAAGKVSTFALRTEALAPEQIVFSPDGQVAAVVLDGAIALVEPDNTDQRVVVPLKLPDGTVLQPVQAAFAPDGAYLYVRARGDDDVLSLEVDKSASGLTSAINFLYFPGGAGLQDILVPQGAGFTRYVAALYTTNTVTLALLDATGDTSKTHSTQLSQPATTLGDLGNGQLLAYADPALAPGAPTRYLAGWEPLLDRLDQDVLSGQVAKSPLVGPGIAFFPHDVVNTSSGSTAALTAVRLEDDGSRLRLRLAPIVLGGGASALAMDAANGMLLVAVDVPRKDSGAAPDPNDDQNFDGDTGSLVAVNADSLSLGGATLDDTSTAVGFAGAYVWAQHSSPFGDITFVPLAHLDRAHARRVTGFLASHLTDTKEATSP